MLIVINYDLYSSKTLTKATARKLVHIELTGLNKILYGALIERHAYSFDSSDYSCISIESYDYMLSNKNIILRFKLMTIHSAILLKGIL